MIDDFDRAIKNIDKIIHAMELPTRRTIGGVEFEFLNDPDLGTGFFDIGQRFVVLRWDSGEKYSSIESVEITELLDTIEQSGLEYFNFCAGAIIIRKSPNGDWDKIVSILGPIFSKCLKSLFP